MAEPIIEIKNLSVVYNPGKSNEVWALKNINVKIYPEEYIIFLGPSGCGKSTLLYTIAGLEFPSLGKVIVKGKDLSSLSEEELINHHRKTIGMVFQAFYLIPSLNVEDNIFLPQMFLGTNIKERIKRLKSLMVRFGIASLAKKYPESLSGGQQQRVAIARALINDPDIILADEPTGNLDSVNAQIVLDLLSELSEKDKRVVVHVTHNPAHLSLADRVFYMKDGKIIREVVNRRKGVKELKEKPKSTIDELAKLYPHLPESRLKAKLIFRTISTPWSIKDENKIEALIEAYLTHKIEYDDLVKALDLPEEKGGLSLYRQRAESLAKKVANLAQEMELFEESERYPPTHIQDKALELTRFLLDSYKGQLKLNQVQRLTNLIEERLKGHLKKDELRFFLDAPLDKGGVGLNKRTAKNFSQMIEVILSGSKDLQKSL